MSRSGIFTGKPKGKGWWRDHSLSVVLLTILVVQSVAYHLLQHPRWVDQQRAHGQPVNAGAYWNDYWAEWVVSVLADTYGALLLVVLSKWLFEKGSAESK